MRRIPITRLSELTEIVGTLEITEAIAEEITALAMEGLTFRLDTVLRTVRGESKLVAVSVSSAFPSVMAG